MYHCHIHFYLIGHTCGTFDIVKEIRPFENLPMSLWRVRNQKKGCRPGQT